MNPLAGWKRAASVGVVLLAVGVLGACGDDEDSSDDGSGGGGVSGPPADASVEEFCEIVNDASWAEGVDTSDNEAVVAALQGWGDELAEVGTPEDIPDDAREGYEISLEQIEALEASDLDKENAFEELEGKLSEDENEKVEAFTEYESETCADAVPDVPEVETS
ncbi:hypothetical protein [Nocardioides antri]|uniref:Lipoprotein n=1 Tax=Nocardioides antri TaxID=2607659 RepID=A0A5B1M894_9ACTN|nr:hypothetical protein [Nocardioides antri]KAA1427910.1 hypothetical protein F0U47_10895 [Nocardioides antri]